MSAQTNAHWFLRSEVQYPEYVDQLMRTLDTFGAATVDLMYEAEWEEDDAAELQALLEGNDKYVDKGKKIPIQTIPKLIRKDRGYFFDLGTTPLGVQIYDASTSTIPLEISGNVAPMGPSICIRRHNLNAGDRFEEYSGRISLSIMLSGWSRPKDFDQFQSLYFRLDVIRNLESDLMAIWGPLERIMYTES